VRQPGEGHALDPVRVDAVRCGAGYLGCGQQLRKPSHQCAVARATTAHQYRFAALLGLAERINDAARGEFWARFRDITSTLFSGVAAAATIKVLAE
jgi:hypothetical protein